MAQEDIPKAVKALMEAAKKASEKDPSSYGFKLGFGEEGIKTFEKYGTPFGDQPGDFHEPETDVHEKEKEVLIQALMPGAKKQDLDLRVGLEALTITCETKTHRYFKEIRLSCRIIPSTVTATYADGILEIVVKRATKEPAGDKVDIK